MELSYLFYGFYKNTVVEDRTFYNIPLAYLFTAVFYFAFCLICIVAWSAQDEGIWDLCQMDVME